MQQSPLFTSTLLAVDSESTRRRSQPSDAPLTPTIPLTGTFENWRTHARTLLATHTPPDNILWQDPHTQTENLFATTSPTKHSALSTKHFSAPRVPPDFLPLAKSIVCHRDPRRWHLLYRTLFRLTHGEPHLLAITVDDDIHLLTHMEKAVRRDAHKTRAFVRFREVKIENAPSHFVAFHRPDHRILPLVTNFFIDRFHDMHWTILTPDASITWTGTDLLHHPGQPRGVPEDAMESFWKTYYENIFNPARVRIRAMVKEMPTRHWRTLPEAASIAELLRTAPTRMEQMIEKTTAAARSAATHLPPSRAPLTLPQLREAAATCTACNICHHATQTVFGEGPATAKLVIVGEQPGDTEDKTGRPFVGPAGQLLNDILQKISLPRSEIYVTNAVKHFKWEVPPNPPTTPFLPARGKRRLHKKPTYTENLACQPWLLAELAAIRPPMILALGTTAAHSLLGPDFRLSPNRHHIFTTSPHAPWLLVTIHPSALLRIPDPTLRAYETALFEHDLRLAKTHLDTLNF